MDARDSTRLTSAEPSGMMVGPNPFGTGIPNNSGLMPTSAGMVPGMRMPFNPAGSLLRPTEFATSLYHGDGSLTRPGSGLSIGEPLKKKRGRPRKYETDGSMALGLIPYSQSSSSEPSSKRRGRPPGSGKKLQMEALGAAGSGFTPHIITVKAGEDVASKIMAFSQQGSRAVCVLSANGAICNVTLRQPATSGGTVAYEGRFEIITLSGSFLLTENGGTRSRTGGLSVSLAGSDGRVLGGGVAGMLLAATPVQVVVASFITEAKNPKPELFRREPLSASPRPGFGGPPPVSPPFQATSSESSDDSGSPLDQCPGACNNSGQNISNMSQYTSVRWPHSSGQPRHDPDM